MEGDCALEGSIARYAKFREWSVWLQRHKIGNARSCTSFLPSRLEEDEVCAKILFADDKRCRVCVNLSAHIPPDSTIGKVARAVEADEGGCRGKISAIIVLIHHLTAPPRCDTLLSSVRVYCSVDTALNVSVSVSQRKERCHYKTTVNICSLTERILEILVTCEVCDILLQVAIYLPSDICVCQTQLVIEGRICVLEVGELRSHG